MLPQPPRLQPSFPRMLFSLVLSLWRQFGSDSDPDKANYFHKGIRDLLWTYARGGRRSHTIPLNPWAKSPEYACAEKRWDWLMFLAKVVFASGSTLIPVQKTSLILGDMHTGPRSQSYGDLKSFVHNGVGSNSGSGQILGLSSVPTVAHLEKGSERRPRSTSYDNIAQVRWADCLS